MRILPLLLIALCLSLTSCAASRGSAAKTASDELPSDLKVLVLGVRALTEPRPIAGEYQHVDEVPNYGAAWDFGGDAEEAHDLSEDDKARARNFVEAAAVEIARGRLPACRWWQLERPGTCRRS